MYSLESIRNKIEKELQPEFLNVKDESHKHATHGNFTGVSHIYIEIKSERLQTLSRIKKHKMIYKLLAEEMELGLHAIRIKFV